MNDEAKQGPPLERSPRTYFRRQRSLVHAAVLAGLSLAAALTSACDTSDTGGAATTVQAPEPPSVPQHAAPENLSATSRSLRSNRELLVGIATAAGNWPAVVWAADGAVFLLRNGADQDGACLSDDRTEGGIAALVSSRQAVMIFARRTGSDFPALDVRDSATGHLIFTDRVPENDVDGGRLSSHGAVVEPSGTGVIMLSRERKLSRLTAVDGEVTELGTLDEDVAELLWCDGERAYVRLLSGDLALVRVGDAEAGASAAQTVWCAGGSTLWGEFQSMVAPGAPASAEELCEYSGAGWVVLLRWSREGTVAVGLDVPTGRIGWRRLLAGDVVMHAPAGGGLLRVKSAEAAIESPETGEVVATATLDGDVGPWVSCATATEHAVSCVTVRGKVIVAPLRRIR